MSFNKMYNRLLEEKKIINESHGPEDPDAIYNVGEYDREGDMAKDQLSVIENAAEQLYAIISSDENLPEWVQAKITLAKDYIDKARDYMMANKEVDAYVIVSDESYGGKRKKSKMMEDADEEEDVEEMEEAARCTKVTQKASSDRKDKKWMKCVKDPDGSGYKRIHWGQKGVRVTGDSGNTQRKKSFRARHKCSTAKPGTPRYQACKDW